jgi:hypothetical protein
VPERQRIERASQREGLLRDLLQLRVYGAAHETAMGMEFPARHRAERRPLVLP